MLKAAYKSDIGRVRSVNEDRVVVKDGVAGGTLAIVADGMGGHQAGDTASQITIELVEASLRGIDVALDEDERAARLVDAIRAANAKVYEIASGKEHYRGMGTTITAALVDANRVLIGHIGDSRAYYIHRNEISQITEDHTLVNELVKTGQLTREEAASHPRRNVITRALGTEFDVEVDVSRLPWAPGDVLLLCSDGLSNLISEAELTRTVRGEGTLDEKAERLVASALDAGGDDNITVVLLANEP
ncbi:Stp1/IreP family PP2C-type Ser/Thr phosphatase [Paenibacillus sp.]|uniref:Stp1/IreP family PP2C-type Ser/Thr phosphatase n=1 Tax=Paenibacillus sp. TaxID=58172 RepID=UPI002D6DFE65|nr:Stp1/IreP family PP2C-type Ser/Thr phosphatase [Paenibacillus sp.]HZG58381.1 Stp1/IreP family PP2C-type Ser/Thr phosphatase [Paenibacillus sp.]